MLLRLLPLKMRRSLHLSLFSERSVIITSFLPTYQDNAVQNFIDLDIVTHDEGFTSFH